MPTLEERVQEWQQGLLDLTNRNRLLNFRHATSRSLTLALTAPEPGDIYKALLDGTTLSIVGTDLNSESRQVDVQPSGPIHEREAGLDTNVESVSQVQYSFGQAGSFATSEQPLLAPSSSHNIPPPALAEGPLAPNATRSSQPSERTNAVAHRLHDRARLSELEQGINTLYAILGRLKWQEKPGDVWRYAPLVLVPIRIAENVRSSSYRISAADEDADFNQTLTELLRMDFGLIVNIDMASDTPLARVFASVREAIGPKPGWEVLEDVHLGILQFHKLRMFQDLSEYAALAMQHPIVQALGSADVLIAGPPEGIPSESELDQVVSPEDSFAILDADASQLRAIQMAKRGSHLIIHGPPGTGKSQTIANIIAECLANGKTILFVSEKAAAIEVVQRRLAENGLGDHCLMLHSHKANKREIINELGSCLDATPTEPATPKEELAHHWLAEIRAKLNSYPESLHRPHGQLQASAFWALGQLSQLSDVPLLLSIAPPSPVPDLTERQLADWEQQLNQLARYGSTLRARDAHPWAWLRPDHLSIADRDRLRQTLSQLSAAIAAVRTAGERIAERFNLPVPASLVDARNLRAIADNVPADAHLLRRWFDPIHHAEARMLAQQAVAHATAGTTHLNRLQSTYRDSILTTATPEAVDAYRRNRVLRLMSRSFRDVRHSVRASAINGEQRPIDVELTYVLDALEVNSRLTWFADRQSQLATELGVTESGPDLLQSQIWGRISYLLDCVNAIVQRFPLGLPAPFLDVSCQPGVGRHLAPLREPIATSLDLAESLLNQLRMYGSGELLATSGVRLSDASFNELVQWSDRRLETFSDLETWVQSQMAMAAAHQHGLATVVSELLEHDIPESQWADVFKRTLLTHWLDAIVASSDDLQLFSAREHEDRIHQFKELDRTCLRWAPGRVRRALQARQRPNSSLHGGESASLRREVQKRRRHIPLRKLFERIPNLLLRLKPCLMMSPLSVAQFLPANLYHFDVVIFDEASQVRPFDAIGAILRGSQLIVAGDHKQLPPTTFFDRSSDAVSEDDDEDIGALESILDALIVKNMPSSRLLWHYRSRHENLIAFSNHHIYDQKLVTFPTPSAQQPSNQGVHLVHVADGSYDGPPSNRVNRNEARKVIELILHHARTRPDQSLGVVALNLNQAEEIKSQLDDALKLHPALGEFFREDAQEPYFTKPLELVQGDERDVIIISVGYGKKTPLNSAEILSHNFGPINRDGGERRLNVLVTRAKHQIVVVSSIRASDIDLKRTQKLGPMLLKNYLDFADRGATALAARTTGGDGDYESPFEESVGTALERLGFRVDRQIGVSRFRIDLAIVDPDHPGAYLLGIECDGSTYHRSKTARDRDRLRQEMLEGFGWTIHRIWSTEWVRQPEAELARIVARVNEIQRQAQEKQADIAPPLIAMLDAETTQSSGLSATFAMPTAHSDMKSERAVLEISTGPTVQTYIVADIGVHDSDDIFTATRVELVNAIQRCVEIEAPVHQDTVSRRLANSWGNRRIGNNIRDRLNAALDDAVQTGRVRRQGSFLWPRESIEPIPRGRLPDGNPRQIEHIADEELLRGMHIVLGHALSLSAEELVTMISRFFEYRRTGSEINERLQRLVLAAAASGAIVAQGDRYRLPR